MAKGQFEPGLRAKFEAKLAALSPDQRAASDAAFEKLSEELAGLRLPPLATPLVPVVPPVMWPTHPPRRTVKAAAPPANRSADAGAVAASPNPRRKVSDRTRQILAMWTDADSPKIITAQLADDIAQKIFSREYRRTKAGSQARLKLRERIRIAVRRYRTVARQL